jgi:hypothetical protein
MVAAQGGRPITPAGDPAEESLYSCVRTCHNSGNSTTSSILRK